jgi:PhnB protein
MAKKVNAKPDQYHALTASLTIKGADKAIEWYTKVFDAKLLGRMGTPDGKSVWHAELRIGDSVLMLNDEDPNMSADGPKAAGAPRSSIWFYTEDVDGRFARAVAAGAKPNMPPMDMFWGDRFAQITDPFGHVWSLATHTEDVPEDQLEARGRKWAEKMAAQTR